VSHEEYLEDLFTTNHQSGNPTSSFTSHTDLTSPEVINPSSGNPTPISEPVIKNDDLVDYSLEEFADELALITFPTGNDDLPVDTEFDLREIEYLLNHDPIEEMDSILEDSVDKNSHDDNLVDTISEMFTDEHALDYSFDLESDNDDVYDDPFDSKEDKIKESKLLINELDPPRSCDFLPSPKYDSV
ncbi:hypothetical protein Tco_0254363, partial [Tanacetum coccineum]